MGQQQKPAAQQQPAGTSHEKQAASSAHPASTSKISTSKINHRGNSERFNRGAAVIILVLQFAYLWIYGFASEIRFLPGINTAYSLYFLLTAVFTVIGFGLVFAYFKTSTMSSIFLSMVIVSFTILFSPILQKFWFNVFIYGFNAPAIGSYTTSNNADLYTSQSGLYINLSFYSLKIALINAISQLMMFTALIGRLSHLQIIMTSFLYNITWTLTHMLCVSIQRGNPEQDIFDGYQISNVYLFAGCFGLMLAVILKNPPSFDVEYYQSQATGILALIGTFFLFITFCVTTEFFVSPNTDRVWAVGMIGQFFALSASIISTYAFSILLGGKIGIRESILGTISGAIMYGPIAQYCVNIGAPIALGVFAGLVSVFYYRVVFVRINKERIYDSMGLIGPGLFVSFLATFFIAPIVAIAYYNAGFSLQTLGAAVGSIGAAGWILIYVAITIAISLVAGAITAVIVRCFSELHEKEYDDAIIFTIEYGLKDEPERHVARKADVAMSASEIKK